MDFSKIKSLTATRLMVLQNVEASILSGEESLKATLEYLFAVSQPVDDLMVASSSKEAWNLAVMVFGDDIDLTDFKAYERHIEADFLRIEQASVEPTEGDTTKKE